MISSLNFSQRVHDKNVYMSSLQKGSTVIVEECVFKGKDQNKRCIGIRLIETVVDRLQRRLITTASGHRFNVTGYAREEGDTRWSNYMILSPKELKEVKAPVIEIVRLSQDETKINSKF